MSTITLRPQLMEQLKQAASEQTTKPEEIVETAVRAYLRQIEREKIKTEAGVFRSMHDKLVKDYPGQYVAIHNGQVVDHDGNFQSLHTRIRQRFGRQPVLLRRVEAEPERALVFHSPRTEAASGWTRWPSGDPRYIERPTGQGRFQRQHGGGRS